MILPLFTQSPPTIIVVDANRVIGHVSPNMYGSCIEDVNHEIYGGLYDQRIFGESFEEPAPFRNWTMLGGRWSSTDGVIHVGSESGPKAVYKKAVSDGTVEGDVRIDNAQGTNAGFLVRVTKAGIGADEFDGYEVAIDTSAKRLILARHVHNFQPLTSVAVSVQAGEWNHLSIQMSGPRIRVFLNGQQKLDFTDTQQPLLSGQVALRTWNADASFRNVVIGGEKAVLDTSGTGVSGLWDAVGEQLPHVHFRLDGQAYNGKQCQEIEHGPGGGAVGVANRGLNRWGISVRKGHRMEGRIYLKSIASNSPVTVALQNSAGTVTYASQTVRAGRSWRRAEFRLIPSKTDPNARFAVWISHPGRLWIDQAVLMDASSDRFRGLPVRKDIGEGLVQEGLHFLRYGGTMVNAPGYRWKKMIGDPDRRPPYEGHWYPYSTNGFGIFDFLNYCEKAHFGAAFAINIEETPRDAADLADYLTAPTSSRWGRKRAEDGHPLPYHPDYIEIGNEEAIGNASEEGYRHYAERFRLLEAAIHGRNPRLKLVCAAWWPANPSWLKTVFDAVDGRAAAWDIHVGGDNLDTGRETGQELDRAQALFKSWNPKTSLKTVIFEENGGRHDEQRALGHALNVNASRARSRFVLADAAANCLQPLNQNDNGWDQGQLFFTADKVWPEPPYASQQIESMTSQDLAVKVLSDGGLDVFASRSEDGKTVALSIVNPSSTLLNAKLDLRGYKLRSGTIYRLKGSGYVTRPLEKNEVQLPAHSLTCIRMVR